MSDLQITHAGTVQTQDRQGPMNPTAPFGQVGSLFSSNLASCKPPLNQVFVAITIIEDGSGFTTLIAEDPDKFANTAVASAERFNFSNIIFSCHNLYYIKLYRYFQLKYN